VDYPSYPAPDPGAPYGRDPATGEPLSDKDLVRGRRLDALIDAIMMKNQPASADTVHEWPTRNP
jgi:hypothetical protein